MDNSFLSLELWILYLCKNLYCMYVFIYIMYIVIIFSVMCWEVLRETQESNRVLCAERHTQGGNSIYIFATLLASLSSLDMLFSPSVLPIGVCKIAIHLYTL